jgi:hypothetical protein
MNDWTNDWINKYAHTNTHTHTCIEQTVSFIHSMEDNTVSIFFLSISSHRVQLSMPTHCIHQYTCNTSNRSKKWAKLSAQWATTHNRWKTSGLYLAFHWKSTWHDWRSIRDADSGDVLVHNVGTCHTLESIHGNGQSAQTSEWKYLALFQVSVAKSENSSNVIGLWRWPKINFTFILPVSVCMC